MLTLTLVVLAAAPTAADAEKLAKSKQWDELYLKFAAASADDTPEKDRPKIASALSRGCSALLLDDAVMALSLAEKSIAFGLQPDALYCGGKAAMKTEQRGEAEQLFGKGAANFAKDPRFPLELGRLALEENQPEKAVPLLAQVPKKARQYAEAQALLKQAKASAATAVSEEKVSQAAQKPAEPPAPEAKGGGRGKSIDFTEHQYGPPPQLTSSASYESGVDGEGRRIRFNKSFRFRYFNGQRDFGQRADYEGRVQAALEKSRDESKRFLGTARESPTDVILYSKEEFTMHHGAARANQVAGFYSENAIRMNDTAEINAHNLATLVHEYVHAVLDEAAGFQTHRLPVWLNEGTAEWVEWRHQGFDGPPPNTQKGLQNIAQQGGLPSLQSMASTSLVSTGNPGLAYAYSGAAVTELVRLRGADSVVGLFRDVGKGAPFAPTFEKRFGLSLQRFEEKLADDLKSR